MLGGDDVKGQSADKSEKHPVSPAPDVDAGESGSRTRLDRPAAYLTAHDLHRPVDPVLATFDDFFRACVGRSMFRCGGTEVTHDEFTRLVEVTP